jgi:hypothetical protein
MAERKRYSESVDTICEKIEVINKRRLVILMMEKATIESLEIIYANDFTLS